MLPFMLPRMPNVMMFSDVVLGHILVDIALVDPNRRGLIECATVFFYAAKNIWRRKVIHRPHCTPITIFRVLKAKDIR